MMSIMTRRHKTSIGAIKKRDAAMRHYSLDKTKAKKKKR
jgi:hypothetical protein